MAGCDDRIQMQCGLFVIPRQTHGLHNFARFIPFACLSTLPMGPRNYRRMRSCYVRMAECQFINNNDKQRCHLLITLNKHNIRRIMHRRSYVSFHTMEVSGAETVLYRNECHIRGSDAVLTVEHHQSFRGT
jgi:hypothetical protein